MEITSIEPQKKKQGRFNLFLDGEFACGLSEEIIVSCGLRVGQELTEEEIEKLLEKDQGAKAYDKALRFLGYRVRSEKEIENKLKEKEFDSKIIQKTIERLKDSGYLNDENFAKTWISDRKAIKPEGKYLIRQELKQKGVSEEIIAKVLKKELPEKEELKLAQKAAQKKKKAYKNLSKREFDQKISAFLARRGFSWEIIKKVLPKL